MDGSYRYGRGGSGRVTKNARDHREGKSQHFQSGRGPSAGFERWETDNNYDGGAKQNQEYSGAKDNFDRGQSPSFTYRQSEPQCLSRNPDARPMRRSYFAKRTVHHRGDTIFSGDTRTGGTRVHTPERFTSRDPGLSSDYGVRSSGTSRREVSPVMRARAESMESDIRTYFTYSICHSG